MHCIHEIDKSQREAHFQETISRVSHDKSELERMITAS